MLKMASKQNGFSFTNIRASPTNPHKPPKYIKPMNIHHKSGSSSGSLSSIDSQNRTELKQPVHVSVFNPHLEDRKMQTQNGGIDHNKIRIEETPGPSSHYKRTENKVEIEEKPEDKTGVWLVKMIIGIIVIVIAIVGTVFFVLYYTHPKVSDPKTDKQTQETKQRPDADTGTGCTTANDELGFKDILTLNCKVKLDGSRLTRLSIFYDPFYGSYKPQVTVYFDLIQSQIWDNGWNVSVYNNTDSFQNTADIIILREPAKCDSGGDYTLQFNASERVLLTHKEAVKIESKVSDVRLEVLQNNKTDQSGTYYEITCTAQSACSPAPIALLGVFGGENNPVPIFGSNFSCYINYNDNDGWRVKCTGIIPQNIYSSLNSIACRPFTGNKSEDVKEQIEYTICRECIFKCPPKEADSYWYDPIRCNVFHRCNYGAWYTMPCSTGTYFNTHSCSCDHTVNILDVCSDKDERIEKYDKTEKCSG